MSIETRLGELGIELPEVPKPVAAYVPAVRAGGFVYTAGQLPVIDGKLQYRGKLGSDLEIEEGYQAARIAALNCLSAIREELGDLDQIEQVVKLEGFVNSASGFTDQSKVINGASDLIGELCGERGAHARVALGSCELPLDSAVEVVMVVKIRE